MTKDDCPVIFHDNFILTEDKVSYLLFFYVIKLVWLQLKFWQHDNYLIVNYLLIGFRVPLLRKEPPG